MAKRSNVAGVEEQQPASATTGASMQNGKTTITLSISEVDKVKVKVYATTHKTTVSDLLHEWICEHCND